MSERAKGECQNGPVRTLYVTVGVFYAAALLAFMGALTIFRQTKVLHDITWGFREVYHDTYDGLAVASLICFVIACFGGIWILIHQAAITFRAWKAIPKNLRRTSPATTIILLILPVINLLWIFQAYWVFSKTANIARIANAPHVKERRFFFYCCFVAFALIIAVATFLALSDNYGFKLAPLIVLITIPAIALSGYWVTAAMNSFRVRQ